SGMSIVKMERLSSQIPAVRNNRFVFIGTVLLNAASATVAPRLLNMTLKAAVSSSMLSLPQAASGSATFIGRVKENCFVLKILGKAKPVMSMMPRIGCGGASYLMVAPRCMNWMPQITWCDSLGWMAYGCRKAIA